MVPTAFQAQYPSLSMVLAAMALTNMQGESASVPTQDDVAHDLARLHDTNESLDAAADALLVGAQEPERKLAQFSTSAYRLLGVSDDVRAFMGRLWAAALRSWSTSQRATFLAATVEDRHDTFQALDFSAELFRHVGFAADELLPWLKAARRQVGNDLMQHGLWNSVRAFCEKTPLEAVRLAMMWLDESPDEESLATIASIIGCLRVVLPVGDPATVPLATLETRLRSSPEPAWRAAYIQSWAPGAESGLLTPPKMEELFHQLVIKDRNEEVAWSYLLHVMAIRQSVGREDWGWIYGAIADVARKGLAAQTQYWLLLTVLRGLAHPLAADAGVNSGDWLRVIAILCPIAPTNQGTWSRLTGALVDFAKTAPEIMRSLVVLLAQGSGREWLECEDRSEFQWFLTELERCNQHQSVASELCFAPGMFCRRLGITVFAACKVPTLDAAMVSSVAANRIELLLLEAQRFHTDYAALARLHAALATRVDELDGDFPELLYDEVARQSRNTHAYRASLRDAAPGNEYLMAIAADAEVRMTETRESAASPALQMDVPGYARASRLHGRHMAQIVANGVAEKSIFLNMVRKVRILYGGDSWRFLQPDGALSEASPFHASSAEIEVPQLEMATPEQAQLRRIQASVRIAQLEQDADKTEPQ